MAMCIRVVVSFLSFLLLSNSAYSQYNDCSTTAYYQNIVADRSLWTKESLATLTKTKHRTCLPYTSNNPDVWDAMIDLDPGANTDTVRLIYANKDVSSLPYGTSDTWNREHTWPKSYGIGESGCDYTDIHMLRPADATVNSARGNKMFGECGVVDIPSDCTSPAHGEADGTTATDSEIWTPPTHVRGDIARAMFYMDLRYYAGGDNDPDLVLTDCPTQTNELGYLSILLKWHEDDPVSDEERVRNERACAQWQGNRNPFVDYPELVKYIYGNARLIPTDGSGYDCNVAPPPTCNNNGQCDATENYLTCVDCPTSVSCNNDGNCDAGEDATNCPSDCSGGPVCGDGVCDNGEDFSSCPSDCFCGNGICDPNEDCLNCDDCPQKTKGKNQYCCDGNSSGCGTATACNDVCHDNGGGGDPPSGCGRSGDSCAVDDDCCSSNCKRFSCKGNGRRLGQPSAFLDELGKVF